MIARNELRDWNRNCSRSEIHAAFEKALGDMPVTPQAKNVGVRPLNFRLGAIATNSARADVGDEC